MKWLETLRSPTFALYAVSAWMISFLVISGSQLHNNISYLILIVPALASLQWAEIKRIFQNTLFRGLVLAIASLVLSAWWNDGNPWQSLKFGLLIIVFFIAVARLPVIREDQVYKAAWGYLGLIMLYIAFNMAWFYAQGSWTPGERMGEMASKLENVIYVTNTLGGMLAIITLLGMKARHYRAVLLAHLLVLGVSLTILQTRSIFGLWLITILLTYLALYRKQALHPKIRWGLLIAGIIAVLSIAALFAYTSIGESLLARNFYRPEIWAGYFAETLHCGVWLGCGPDHGFQYISHDGMVMIHPHSLYLTQFYKAGLIGLVPLLAVTLWASIQGFKAQSWAAWYFMCGAFGLAFDGSSLVHSPNQRWLVFHLPLALLIAQQLHHAAQQSKLLQPGLNGQVEAKPLAETH